MTADIFISFASQDRKVATTICTALESRGFQCWISGRDIQPGENFQVAIVQAIRRAKIMLLVFTENSNSSQEMTKELALASQQKLIVIPLRVEDVTPSDAFAYEFATRQWIDLFSDWEVAVDQLSQRIAKAIAIHSAEAGPVVTPVISMSPSATSDEGSAVADAPSARAVPAAQDPATLDPAALDSSVAAEMLSRLGLGAARPGASDDETESAEFDLDAPAAAIEAPAPSRPKMLRLALIGAAIVAVVGVGLAVPQLLRPKAKPQAPMLAMARVQALETTPAATEPTLAAAEPTAEVAPAVVAPTVKRARKAAKPVESEIPY